MLYKIDEHSLLSTLSLSSHKLQMERGINYTIPLNKRWNACTKIENEILKYKCEDSAIFNDVVSTIVLA